MEKILGMREKNEAEVGEERFTFFEQESQMNADTAFKRKKLVSNPAIIVCCSQEQHFLALLHVC